MARTTARSSRQNVDSSFKMPAGVKIYCCVFVVSPFARCDILRAMSEMRDAPGWPVRPQRTVPGVRPLDGELLRSWLKKKQSGARALKLLAAIGSMAAGLLVLFVSFWVAYGVIWFISFSFYRLKHRVILAIAGAFMALVIAVGARQNRQSIEPLDRQNALARDMDITLTPWTRYGMSYTTNAAKAAEFEIRSVASVVNYILCGGVILLLGGVARFREFWRMKGLDLEDCARVIGVLHAAGRRQSFAQILEQLPGLNPVIVFEHLRSIEGVLFLSNDPPGLTLHPDLKEELLGLVRKTESQSTAQA